jgi:hypothetical protein
MAQISFCCATCNFSIQTNINPPFIPLKPKAKFRRPSLSLIVACTSRSIQFAFFLASASVHACSASTSTYIPPTSINYFSPSSGIQCLVSNVVQGVNIPFLKLLFNVSSFSSRLPDCQTERQIVSISLVSIPPPSSRWAHLTHPSTKIKIALRLCSKSRSCPSVSHGVYPILYCNLAS